MIVKLTDLVEKNLIPILERQGATGVFEKFGYFHGNMWMFAHVLYRNLPRNRNLDSQKDLGFLIDQIGFYLQWSPKETFDCIQWLNYMDSLQNG